MPRSRRAAQLVGCENAAESGSVKYLSDDLKLECEGTEAGKARGSSARTLHGWGAVLHTSLTHAHPAQICAARNPSSFPSFMGGACPRYGYLTAALSR